MLRIRDLRKTLPGTPPRQLLCGIELALAPGEYVAIMGESGSGKSTLLNLIAGLERVESGHIELGDTDIAQLDDTAATRLRAARMGFVFQAFHILPHLTVAQNVALPLAINHVEPAAANARVIEMLAAVGLAARADARPRELSGGELQRVAIARALAHRPALLLADEPTGNLDPDTAQRIQTLLAESVRRERAIGILVTHSREAAASADRVLMLGRDGRLAPA